MNLHDVMENEVVYNNKTFKVIEIFPTGYMLVVDQNSEFPAQPLVIPNVLGKE